MRHQFISFKKYFYVPLGNNFYFFFCGGPWAKAQFASPLKSGPGLTSGFAMHLVFVSVIFTSN